MRQKFALTINGKPWVDFLKLPLFWVYKSLKMGSKWVTIHAESYNWLISNILWTTVASSFKIYYRVVPTGPYIPTGNNVVSYFHLATNLINIPVTMSRFLNNRPTDFEMLTVSERVIHVV